MVVQCRLWRRPLRVLTFPSIWQGRKSFIQVQDTVQLYFFWYKSKFDMAGWFCVHEARFDPPQHVFELPIRRRGGLRRLTCCSAPVVRDRILGARLAIDLRYALGTLRLGHIAVTSRLGLGCVRDCFFLLFGAFCRLNIFCSVGLGAIIPFAL